MVQVSQALSQVSLSISHPSPLISQHQASSQKALKGKEIRHTCHWAGDIIPVRICEVLWDYSQSNSNQGELNEMYKGLESFARYMASQENVTFEDIVEELLIALGIPASLNGYGYLKEAIVIYHRLGGEGRRVRITKYIYPAVALKYKTSSACAERSMRHAVCTAFTRGSLSFIDSVFSLTVDESKGKPTNSEFVAMLNHRAKWVLKIARKPQ